MLTYLWVLSFCLAYPEALIQASSELEGGRMLLIDWSPNKAFVWDRLPIKQQSSTFVAWLPGAKSAVILLARLIEKDDRWMSLGVQPFQCSRGDKGDDGAPKDIGVIPTYKGVRLGTRYVHVHKEEETQEVRWKFCMRKGPRSEDDTDWSKQLSGVISHPKSVPVPAVPGTIVLCKTVNFPLVNEKRVTYSIKIYIRRILSRSKIYRDRYRVNYRL